jgi:thiol-disulfide isomerase/thioredoxin
MPRNPVAQVSFDARRLRWQPPAMKRMAKPRKTVAGSGMTVADLMFYVGLGMVAAGAGFLAALMIPGSGPRVRSFDPTAQERQTAAPAPALGTFISPAGPQALPDLAFTSVDGKPHRLAEWRGKVVLLNLWATWCAPCKVEMPSLDRLQAKLGGDAFAVLALSVDRSGTGKPAEFFSGNGITHLAVYNDSESTATAALRASGLPVSVILDAQGREVARLIGPADWDSPTAIAKVEEFIKANGGKG